LTLQILQTLPIFTVNDAGAPHGPAACQENSQPTKGWSDWCVLHTKATGGEAVAQAKVEVTFSVRPNFTTQGVFVTAYCHRSNTLQKTDVHVIEYLALEGAGWIHT
jgi:hypothetical protein